MTALKWASDPATLNYGPLQLNEGQDESSDKVGKQVITLTSLNVSSKFPASLYSFQGVYGPGSEQH